MIRIFVVVAIIFIINIIMSIRSARWQRPRATRFFALTRGMSTCECNSESNSTCLLLLVLMDLPTSVSHVTRACRWCLSGEGKG